MTLTPRFLLVLSLFQISLGLGWILGYVFLPPTIFCYERAAERSLAGEYRTVRPEGLKRKAASSSSLTIISTRGRRPSFPWFPCTGNPP